MLNLFRKNKTSKVKASFDLAKNSEDNFNHWRNANYTSANLDTNAQTRQTLRIRSRYEIANNSYADGISQTIANDTIGSGAKLQMLSDDEKLNNEVESLFYSWADEVRLAEKLRLMRLSRFIDGEAFLMFCNNPKNNHEIKLNLQVIDPDRITDNNFDFALDKVEGIEYDQYGNPTKYNVLKNHPTNNFLSESYSVRAEDMIHHFIIKRAGQCRGIPEMTSSLPLFALLRRYTLAVVSSAESIANISGVIYSDLPCVAEDEETSPVANDKIELSRNMFTTLPGGWKIGQPDAKQPTSTYVEFKREILNEIARSISMPFNIAACNSSGYNYASGRMDAQTYHKSIKVDQSFIEKTVLDRIFRRFYREYSLLRNQNNNIPEHSYFWDGYEHVDPAKEANAQATKLGNLTTSLASEYAKNGKDWEVELMQIAKEKKRLAELNLSIKEATNNNVAKGEDEDVEENK